MTTIPGAKGGALRYLAVAEQRHLGDGIEGRAAVLAARQRIEQGAAAEEGE